MHRSPAGATTGHARAVDAFATWLIGIDRRTGGVTLDGGQFAQHGALQVFLAGWLAQPASPDTLVRAFAERGDAAFAECRGQFALAVGEPNGDITVLRDPHGTYPVFFAETGSTVWVSNTIRRLLEQPGVSRDLNRLAIADHLCKRWPDRSETYFASVRRVPSGHLLRVSGGTVTIRRYWTVEIDQIDWVPDRELERFDALLDQAVSRVLSPTSGVFLSGGFDSVSVAAVAADLARRHGVKLPHALSLAFPDPACDEAAIQGRVAETLGLPFDLLPFFDAAGPDGLLAGGLALGRTLDAPLLNIWVPAYLSLIRRARAAGVDTIMTGEGGDEWLGTSPFLAADLIRRGRLGGLVNVVRTWRRSYRQTWPTILRGVIWTFGVRPLVGMWGHRLAPARWDARRARKAIAGQPAWFVADRVLARRQFERAIDNLTPADPPHGFYRREGLTSLENTLQARMFEEQFQIGAANRVRYAHPYWDPDLVTHLRRVRPERLDAGQRSKALVRQTLARRFPALGFERQRKAEATAFFAGIVGRQGAPLAHRISQFRGLAGLGLVDPARARAFLQTALLGSAVDVGTAWNLVNMEVWVRHQTGEPAEDT